MSTHNARSATRIRLLSYRPRTLPLNAGCEYNRSESKSIEKGCLFHAAYDRHNWMMMTDNIRTARPEDAAELARLFTELGHATTEDEVRTRWSAWQAGGNVGLVVDGAHNELIGAATLHQTIVLHRPKPIGRISALIVDARHRDEGIGRALVNYAERMFRDAGCGMVEVTSNMRRADAHAFYQHLGYELTSARFMKPLS